jgi:GxxExxY protein
MDNNQITGIIIGSAIQVHKILGPGMLESVYEECLAFELERLNLNVERQKAIPLVYRDIKFDFGYRIDMMVENRVLLELKAIESITIVHVAQILTYMRFANVELGLLVNFNVTKLINGIKRFIL